MKNTILSLCFLFTLSSCGAEWLPLLAVTKSTESISNSTRNIQPVLSCSNSGFNQLAGDTEKNINVKLYRELVEDVLVSFNQSGRDIKNFWRNLPTSLRNHLSYSLALIAIEENIKSIGLFEAMPLYIYVLSHNVPIDAKVKITDKRDSRDKFAFKLRALDSSAVYSNSGCSKNPVNKIEVVVPEEVITRNDVSQLWRCVTKDFSFHILESQKNNFIQSGQSIIRIPSEKYQKTESSKLISIRADQDTLLLSLDINKRRYFPVERFNGRETRAEIQSAFLKASGMVSCNSLLKEI